MSIRRTLGALAAVGLALLLVVFGAAGARAVEVERVVSAGGIEAWLVSEPSIPILSVQFAFNGGARLDPADVPGVSYLVSGLLDEGAGELDSLAFQTALEELAVDLGFDAGRDQFNGKLRTLSEYREPAFDLLRQALTAPRFDAQAVERVRRQVLASLAQEATNPNQVARKLWAETVFAGHPYGRPVGGTVDSMTAITIDQLKDFVARQFVRDRLIIGVAGDMTAVELGPLLDRAFGGLAATSADDEAIEMAPPPEGRLIVRRMSVPQSVVVMGQQGLPRDHPDYYTAYVMNHVLGGGGFGSRLTREVREKRGLAYSVYSYLMPLDYAPLLLGGVATENARVAETLDVISGEFRKLRDDGVGEAELDDAITYLTGSFPLRLDSNGEVARLLVGMQIAELGLDYIDRRNDLIRAVTQEDVARVARDLLDPDGIAIVVVGDPEGLDADTID